jgi:4'-phosphopantetheinyl transferase
MPGKQPFRCSVYILPGPEAVCFLAAMEPCPSDAWKTTLPGSPIAAGEAVVWRIPLLLPEHEVAIAAGLLAADEAGRAGRFFRERDRQSFTIQRAALRMHAAACVGEDPRAIRFVAGGRGKPALAGPGAWLHFNASGSGEIGLLAFTRDAAIGVDVEKHRELDAAELAGQFFSREEAAELHALPAPERREGFFNGWSRKEAFIKAVGDGLYFPLDRFSVTLSPGAAARLLSVDGSPERAAEWSLRAIDAAPGYSAAVVRRGGPFALRLLDSPPPSQWPPL